MPRNLRRPEKSADIPSLFHPFPRSNCGAGTEPIFLSLSASGGILPGMLQPRLLAPIRVLERVFTAPSIRSSSQHLYQSSLPVQRTLLSSPILKNNPTPISSRFLSFSQVRHASHATQGAANQHSRDPPGKRLGAKRTGGEYVVPGCIIFRQRGSKWYPGENCAMGRDHTIYATEAGYVRYYLDPERHPDKKYIGVCFEKDGVLPTPRNAPRKRRLNRVAVPRITAGEPVTADGTDPEGSESATTGPKLRPGYMYRESNWEIGRAADRAGITVPEYNRKNRWLAWRKRQARAERAAQMKSIKGKKKASKKSKGRG
ncbi:54S ribosomal protein L2 mitochondrial [Monascus purpureus]|uniref:Large ribosomal subunit protein bL27m n=1 Tax=Monascus purpureus TaxID=5098 RepID=A0A507QL54_MONPU|nr:54S ribosomal protein L2 mitochondrial [Monascus purpureus]